MIRNTCKERNWASVNFSLCEPEWDASSIIDLYLADPESWRRFARLFHRFDDLYISREVLSNYSLIYAKVKELVIWYYNQLIDARVDALKRLREAWSCHHYWWMSTLDEYFDASGGSGDPITVWLGINLMSPRSIEERLFSLPFYVNLDRQIAICAHEILHIRYFECIVEIDPSVQPLHFNYPHKIWQISEVIAAVIAKYPPVERCFGPGAENCYACSDETFRSLVDDWSLHRASGKKFQTFYDYVNQRI